MDENYIEWGESLYFIVMFMGIKCVLEVLIYVYVFVFVFDNVKYYWVGDDEVEKLIEKGGEWLYFYLEWDFIVKCYFKCR